MSARDIDLPVEEASSLVLTLGAQLRELERRKEFLWRHQTDACVHLILDHRLTISEVARAAGVNRQTLYRYVKMEEVRRGTAKTGR